MDAAAIRVLVADDHPIVRGGLVALLGTLPGLEVVGQAADGATALRETLLTRPDVVVLDLRMPVLDGVTATRRITEQAPGTGVLVLTMSDDDDLAAEALAAGARGYLLKGAEPEEIERAVRSVASGSIVLAPQIAGRVLGRAPSTRPVAPFPQLTARERDVLGLVAVGRANAEIADELRIAPKTVGNHISAVFLKLGVTTRAQAIVAARDAGFGA